MGDITEALAEILAFLPLDHPLRPLALEGSAQLVWLGPETGRQVLLRLSAGRYTVEYWGKGRASPLGVEVATGPTLVLGPPSQRPLVAFIRVIE